MYQARNKTLLALLAILFATQNSLVAQTFQSRNQRQSSSNRAVTSTRTAPTTTQKTATTSVSQDLLKIYQATKTAKTEQKVSNIIRACQQIERSNLRSRADVNYARSLIAWGLNRRGELRNDRAAQLVGMNKLDDAEKLDSLAAEDFKTAIEYDSRNWRTHHNYAISLAMNGQYESAIDELDTAIELQPKYANSHFNRGELYFEIGQYDSAVENYEQAIQLDAKDPQFYNSRAHSLFMLERYDESIEDYVQATTIAKNDSTFHTDLADAYQYLGRWTEAAASYQAAVGADSKNARAYQNAAWLMATCPQKSVRNAELALAAAKRAIELSGRDARSIDTLAAATAATGKTRDASKLQSEAIELSEDQEEREEFAERLKIYQRGSAYKQPDAPSSRTAAQEGNEAR